MGNSRFFLQKVGDREYKFILVKPDGQVLLTSKLYSDRYSCEQGMKMIRQNSKSEKVYEKGRSPNGFYFFNFKLPNNELLAMSEMCVERAELIEFIDDVKRFATEAVIAER